MSYIALESARGGGDTLSRPVSSLPADGKGNCVSRLLALVSWRGWGMIRYNSIWQNLAGLFYIALVDRLFTLTFIGQVGLFLLFSTLMTGFG